MIHQLQKGCECERQHLAKASGQTVLNIHVLFPIFSHFYSVHTDFTGLTLLYGYQTRAGNMPAGGCP